MDSRPFREVREETPGQWDNPIFSQLKIVPEVEIHILKMFIKIVQKRCEGHGNIKRLNATHGPAAGVQPLHLHDLNPERKWRCLSSLTQLVSAGAGTQSLTDWPTPQGSEPGMPKAQALPAGLHGL